MTGRERLQTVLAGRLPDRVPVAPDFSNMIPARMTGKPFWDLYLYNDPPIWDAYIDCARHFDIDSVMDGYFPLVLSDPDAPADPRPPAQPYIVYRDADRLVTQDARVENGRFDWAATVNVYYRADPPSWGVPPEKIGLPSAPGRWEPVEGIRPVDKGPDGLARVMARMGDQGLVGVWLAGSAALNDEEDVYRYYDAEDDERERWARERVEAVERRFYALQRMAVRPDFYCVGGSGSLIYQTEGIFRQLALPAVKRAVELASAAGIPTHMHSCGPEAALVRIMATETGLTVIDPLEIPPMGDCDLAALKRDYGDRLTLKGNLHTTDVMLRGTPDDVRRAARQAMDDAARGGRFILSTGDQCGRDTPDENLRALVDTARTYGRYRPDGTIIGDADA